MKAVVLKAYGDADQLSYEEVEKPRPGSDEALVRIAVTSVNPIDWKLRSGVMRQFMPLELPAVLGRDVAGEVVEIGADVTSVAVGQRVLGMANRTYAEFTVVDAEDLAPMPAGLSFEQAAALPLVTLTGAQLIERGIKPKRGQSLLLTGALGGVGRTAAYVAAQHHAQVMIAVRPSQMADAELLGTIAVVSLDDDETLAKTQELDGFADTVGGPVALKLLKLVRQGGVYASVVGLPKEVKEYDIHTEAIRARPDAARLAQLAEDVARGRFKIPIAKVMRLSEIRAAHRLAEAGGLGGKLVLIP